MEIDADVVPRVTPYLLDTAETLCPRRLASELDGSLATADPVNRARVRNALLDAIRVWHETSSWTSPPGLLAEEGAVVAHACQWYEQLFPDPVAEVTLPLEEPTLLPRRGVRLGGWVDLGITHTDGSRELRQLAWDGRAAPADPLERSAIRLAVLRLARQGWNDDQPLAVSWADLLHGTVSRARLEPDALQPIADWLDARLAATWARADPRETEEGASCGTCRFVPRCPAHQVRGSMLTRKDSLVPGVLSLSPTGLETWRRCPREWRNRVLLRLPPSNPIEGTQHGLFLHKILHLVHRTGSCHDVTHVAEVLESHDADARTAEELQRHARRCPMGAEPIGHEIEWCRAHPPAPVFLATARVDTAWVHDGLLDVRDYKTGRVATSMVREDPRARVQAWVAARQAATRGLRLRLRYEHLASEVLEDPEPWEPGDEELDEIEGELTHDVLAMLAERTFRGVTDEELCGRCGYRAVCDDSAVAAELEWPRPRIVEAVVGPERGRGS